MSGWMSLILHLGKCWEVPPPVDSAGLKVALWDWPVIWPMRKKGLFSVLEGLKPCSMPWSNCWRRCKRDCLGWNPTVDDDTERRRNRWRAWRCIVSLFVSLGLSLPCLMPCCQCKRRRQVCQCFFGAVLSSLWCLFQIIRRGLKVSRSSAPRQQQLCIMYIDL